MSKLTFSQDSTRQKITSVGIVFSSVPVQQISGTDTSFGSALSFSPVLEWRAKNGWGLSYSPSLVSSAGNTGIYLHTISAGYERYGSGKMDIAFSYSHFFFTSATTVPYSPLNNDMSLYLNYTRSWLQPLVAASFGIGKDTTVLPSSFAHDLSIAFGFNHGFSWQDKGIFSSMEITPSILVNAGTNGYFSFLSASKYLSQSSHFIKMVKKQNKGKGSGKKQKASDLPSAPFALSNVEGGLEANLEIGSFTIRPGASVILPLGSGGDEQPYTYGQVSLQWHF